jgi:hypothetical protein
LACNSSTFSERDDFKYLTHNTRAQEVEMLLTSETISLIFSMSIRGTTIAAKEGSNSELSKYFQGEDGKHYVPWASYLIAKTHSKEIVVKLEAFTKTCTFC